MCEGAPTSFAPTLRVSHKLFRNDHLDTRPGTLWRHQTSPLCSGFREQDAQRWCAPVGPIIHHVFSVAGVSRPIPRFSLEVFRRPTPGLHRGRAQPTHVRWQRHCASLSADSSPSVSTGAVRRTATVDSCCIATN